MGNSQYSTLVLIALMVVAFYFLIIRPNKKRQQAQQATMSSLQAGTRVLLTSGLFGTIVQVGEKQAVLELSPGVQLTVLKQAIARTVRPGDEDGSDDEVDDDDVYDEEDAATPASGAYGSSAVGTSPGSTDSANPWSAEATDPVDRNSPPSTSSTEQDPRAGTNTTPNKD